MKAITISKPQVRDIMRAGDRKSLKKIFRILKLDSKNEGRINLTSGARAVLIDVLTMASVQAEQNELKEEVAWMLINNIAPHVESFQFLHNLAFYQEEDDFSIISSNVREAVGYHQPSDEIFGEIEAMSSRQIFALICFITTKLQKINSRFNRPIIRRLYGERFVPSSLLFGLMAACLEEPKDEFAELQEFIAKRIITEMSSPLSDLFGFDVEDALDDDGDEDEEGEDDEDGAF